MSNQKFTAINWLLIPGLFVLLFITWTAFRPVEPDSGELMKIEREFSARSLSVGSEQAFLEYMDTTAVLLRAGYAPLAGDSARQFLKETAAGPGNLSWDPTGAAIAKAGDIGYTYGVYTYKSGTETHHGTYTTYWKKNRQGRWKFVLDTGNAGLSGNP